MKPKKYNYGDYTLQYMPMIRRAAMSVHRAFSKTHDISDLVAEGVIASLQAEKTYDPGRGKFGTFIRLRAKGAMINSVTTTSSKHQRILDRVFKYLDTYAEAEGAIPSLEMALEHLGIRRDKYNAALSASESVAGLVLDITTDSTSTRDGVMEDVYDSIHRLPKADRTVLIDMLADKKHNQKALAVAVEKLKIIMEIDDDDK